MFTAHSLVSITGNQIDTLQSTDSLTGTGTNPTLNAVLATGTGIIANPTLTGIETINVQAQAAAQTLNLSKATGVKAVNLDISQQNLTIQSLGTNATVGVENSLTTTDALVRFADSVVSGAADTAKVTLTSNGVATVAGAQQINLRGTTAGGFETIEITAVGANRIAEILSDASVGLNVAATGTNSVRTIKVSGDGSLRVDTALTSTTTFDASANKGGVNVQLNNAGNVTATGGEGNDTFNLAATLTNTDKVDGGAGRNTLATTNAITVGHQLSNIQILRNDGAAGGTVFDNDTLTSVDTIVHNSANTATYQDMVGANAADSAKGLTLQGVGVATFNIKGATGLGGNSDALYVNVGSATGTTGVNAAGGAAGSVTTAGTEKVTFNVAANNTAANIATGVTLTGDAATNSVVIQGGATGVNFAHILAGATGAALTSIDGSSFAGNLTVAGNAFAQVIKGGSGNDNISTGGHAAFADGVSSDVLTGGAGNDTFAFATADTAYTVANLTMLAASTNDGYSELTTITDLNLGGAVAGTAVDLISFAAVGGANTAATLGDDTNTTWTVVNGGAATALTGANFGAAVNALFLTGGVLDSATATEVRVGLFTWGGETFLVAGEGTTANDGFAGGVAGSDIVIRVTGVTGTLDAGDFAAFV